MVAILIIAQWQSRNEPLLPSDIEGKNHHSQVYLEEAFEKGSSLLPSPIFGW